MSRPARRVRQTGPVVAARLTLVALFVATVVALGWADRPLAPTLTRAGGPTTPATTAPAPTTTAPTTTTTAPLSEAPVFLFGDSVLLGAKEEVPAALPGREVVVEAVGSRRLPQVIQVLDGRREELAGAVVVMDVGNNYLPEEGSFADQIDEAMAILADSPRVVWVTLAEKWPSRVELNAAIRDAPARWPTAVVADWAPVAAAHPELLDDGLHLTDAGADALARLIAETVTGAPAGADAPGPDTAGG